MAPNERNSHTDTGCSSFFDHYLVDDPASVWMTVGVSAIQKGKTRGFELEE